MLPEHVASGAGAAPVVTSRMRLAMVSHVAPVPSTAGQNQRVRYSLEALRQEFDVTLVTTSSNLETHPEVADHADAVIGVGGRDSSLWTRAVAIARGSLFGLTTGLKRSNYDISRLFAPAALSRVLDASQFDLAYFHYWHATDALPVFQGVGTRCVLDMHDILWRARGSQLRQRRFVPSPIVERQQRRDQIREEAAWCLFDGVIAINAAERDEVRVVLGPEKPLWYAPMGVHLERWPYRHAPAGPRRLAFYGGLSTPARELAAAQCADEIMPPIWEKYPDCELWIIGANPTDRVRRLANERVHVTGFVADPAEVLASMWGVLCPFYGRFGFRSRLIEVMACGVPIVATPDAIHGMGLDGDDAILLHEESSGMADACLRLLATREESIRRGLLARAQAERFGFDATYGELARELAAFARSAHP